MNLPALVLKLGFKGITSAFKRSVILPNRATVEGLLDHLSLGCGGMIICSELGEWLETLEKKHTGPLKPLLTDFYDVPQEYVYKTRTQKTLRVNEPYITINAVSTIELTRERQVLLPQKSPT